MMMNRDEIRLRILELALEHGISTHKVGVAEDFSEFVFDQEPGRIRPVAAFGKLTNWSAPIRGVQRSTRRSKTKKRR